MDEDQGRDPVWSGRPALGEDRASRSHLRRLLFLCFDRKGGRSALKLRRNAELMTIQVDHSVACSRWMTLAVSWFKYCPVRAILNPAFYLTKVVLEGLGVQGSSGSE